MGPGIYYPFAMNLQLALLAALTLAPPGEEAPGTARELLLQVVENQERNQSLQRQYAYVETVTTRFLQDDGTVSKAREESFAVSPAPGGEYRRLIEKNGRPLTADEERKEEKKFQDYLKKQLELSPEELAAKEDNLKKRAGRFESRIREALEVFEFVPLPDEELSGRSVRVFRFTPRPDYEPHTRATDILYRTEGTIWIDPERFQIAKLFMRFREDMKFLAGLFGRISKGTEAVAVQRPIGDEVWLFDHIDVSLKGRFYFLKKYNRQLSFKYRDYRKYTVRTEEKVGPVSEQKRPQP